MGVISNWPEPRSSTSSSPGRIRSTIASGKPWPGSTVGGSTCGAWKRLPGACAARSWSWVRARIREGAHAAGAGARIRGSAGLFAQPAGRLNAARRTRVAVSSRRYLPHSRITPMSGSDRASELVPPGALRDVRRNARLPGAAAFMRELGASYRAETSGSVGCIGGAAQPCLETSPA